MIAVPIALVLFGYWVLYGGLKRVSLADAWSCSASSRGQTQTSQSGTQSGVSFGPGNTPPPGYISQDCRPRPGDVKLPALPWDNGKRLILRPIGSGFMGVVNTQLVGPC